MKKKEEKPADTYIVMGDIPCPMHVAHYVDILQKNKTCYLLVGAVDADGVIHHVRCPLRLAYDLPVGAILRPGAPIMTESAEYCGYDVKTRELWLPDIRLMLPQDSAAASEEVCRVDNNLCLGAVQGVRYRDEVYLLPPFALVRAFLGAEARLLTMIARGDDLRKKYDIEMVDESVVVTPHVRIADRTLKMLIQYNGDPNLRLMLHEMVSHLAVGDCTSDLWIPDVSGKLICKMITVGGYHILLDADAAELPVTYPDIKRVRQQRDKNKIVLPPADKPLLRTPKVDLSAESATEAHRRTALHQKQMPAPRFGDKISYKSTYRKSSDPAYIEQKDKLVPFVPNATYAAQDVDPDMPLGEKNSRPELDFEASEMIPVELPPGYEQFEDFKNMLARLGRFLAVREIKVQGYQYPDDTPAAALRGRQYLMCYINIGSVCLCVLELARRNYPSCSTLVLRLDRTPAEALAVCTTVLQEAGGHWGDRALAGLPMIARTMTHRYTLGVDRRERALARLLRKLLLYQF